MCSLTDLRNRGVSVKQNPYQIWVKNLSNPSILRNLAIPVVAIAVLQSKQKTPNFQTFASRPWKTTPSHPEKTNAYNIIPTSHRKKNPAQPWWINSNGAFSSPNRDKKKWWSACALKNVKWLGLTVYFFGCQLFLMVPLPTDKKTHRPEQQQPTSHFSPLEAMTLCFPDQRVVIHDGLALDFASPPLGLKASYSAVVWWSGVEADFLTQPSRLTLTRVIFVVGKKFKIQTFIWWSFGWVRFSKK